ncbi:unnamed protein product, partial [Phaeothamnion confervicola]
MAAAPFRPQLKPGQLPGQEPLRVSAWSVEDVARWLQTLALPQYREAFVDAAVDGAFLYDIDEDDLRNTLGVEHRLHRKKLLNAIERLRRAEAERDRALTLRAVASGASGLGSGGGAAAGQAAAAAAAAEAAFGGAAEALGGAVGAAMAPGGAVRLPELLGLTRHGKFSKIKEALANVPSKKFDPQIVRVPFVDGFGT